MEHPHLDASGPWHALDPPNLGDDKDLCWHLVDILSSNLSACYRKCLYMALSHLYAPGRLIHSPEKVARHPRVTGWQKNFDHKTGPLRLQPSELIASESVHLVSCEICMTRPRRPAVFVSVASGIWTQSVTSSATFYWHSNPDWPNLFGIFHPPEYHTEGLEDNQVYNPEHSSQGWGED